MKNYKRTVQFGFFYRIFASIKIQIIYKKYEKHPFGFTEGFAETLLMFSNENIPSTVSL